MTEGLSFWAEIHEPFMKRDLTREDVRQIVQAGLAYTRGNYKMLVRAFNMPPHDYKRFLSFLRTHGCHVSYQSFRMVRIATRCGVSSAGAVNGSACERRRARTGFALRLFRARTYDLAACAMNRATSSIATTSIGCRQAIRRPKPTSLGTSVSCS